MDTKLLYGKPVADYIYKNNFVNIEKLRLKNIIPNLAVIIIGNDPASSIYVKSKAKAFNKLNCFSKIYHFDANVKKTAIIDQILELNNNSTFHGILLQLPLPEGINKEELIQLIDPNKDVDCFHPLNQGYLLSGKHKFVPCTPLGCIEILKYYNINSYICHLILLYSQQNHRITTIEIKKIVFSLF